MLIHRQHLAVWNELADGVGLQNAQRVWDHLAMHPDKKPSIGSVTPMKGGRYKATADGRSRVYHYEVSGAGRIDYRYHPSWKATSQGDPHPVVWIVSIDLASH